MLMMFVLAYRYTDSTPMDSSEVLLLPQNRRPAADEIAHYRLAGLRNAKVLYILKVTSRTTV